MAATFGNRTIDNAQPYWLERLPYTQLVTNLPAQGQFSLFAVDHWQADTDPATVIMLDAVAATQQPGVQLQVINDTQQGLYDLDIWPPNLRPLPIGRSAIHHLSAVLTNTTTSAIANLQVTYHITIWREPVAYKVLYGYPLTATERAYAHTIGLDTAPNSQRGTLPLGLDSVIRGTYANRRIGPALGFGRRILANGTPFHTIRAATNQLLVLRSMATAGTLEDGVQLHVDRDGQTDHVIVDAAAMGLGTPVECLVPAKTSLTFRLTATTPPAAAVPVQLEVWPLSLSNILRIRLGELTEAQLQQVVGTQTGAKQYAAVKAGMN